MQHLRRALRAAKAWKRHQAERLKKWWAKHRERLAQETGYSNAFATVLIAAADLFLSSYRVRFAVRELVRAYLALQRIFSPAVAGREWAVAT